MNDKEEFKKAVIESCINGTITVKVAADRLDFSERYVKKLKARYKKIGASSMMHGNCGKQPKHTINANIKSKIWEIWSTPELEECNFTHFQEILEEDFYGDTKEYCLHGFIDDATHQVTGLYMCENECMHGYLEVTRQNFKNFGVPLALYADGSSIFFPKDKKLTIEEQLAGITEPTTQYGRMMKYLGVDLIHAGSSQAKGRVERLWNTLHDRLRTEFRRHNITTIEEANEFLKTYIPKFNKRFSIEPKSQKSSFMRLTKYVNLDYLLSVKYTRTVDVSNCISISGTTFVIDTKEILHK